MSGGGRSRSEMFELLRGVQDTSTNIFEILDIENHEKRLTRYLAWLLDPDAGHDTGTVFLEGFLDCFGLELRQAADVDVRYLETFPSSVHGQKEIDLVIETEEHVIGVEIKTTHTENKRKFEEEADALEAYATDADKQEVEMLYLPHLESEKGRVAFTDQIATWRDVLDELRTHRGVLETPHEIALFDDFVSNIEDNVIKQRAALSKKSELYLKYHGWLDEFQIDVGPSSFKHDRKEIYNHLWDWFTDKYEAWDGQFNRERSFGKNARYVRLYKNSWHLAQNDSGMPKTTLEIQGTEKRLRWYKPTNAADLYRPTEPHFEMTVALNDDTEEQWRRNRFEQYLEDEELQALRQGGFRRVDDWLAEVGAEAAYNKYHLFSKIIEINFDKPDLVRSELKEGLRTFVALENAIDRFTDEYEP